ncbi:unnamed protein product [Caenorhabditis auriculariae]|uniref:RING-CH-type domain-containing protein n=1 Tax=Caenorhabditis auriculariae TaxID=2777116 RepID=A0A8S1HDA5_9PELO|nr:unnamed protein product [Caenorhabditis auriculariae]
MTVASAQKTTSHHSINIDSTQASAVSPKRHPWSPTTATTSTTSKRLCRICQSDSGLMVRPCDCAGTMGDIHENCLSRWVAMSHKNDCEICKKPYAKSGSQFKKFSEWTRPKLGLYDLLGGLIVAMFSYSIYYTFELMEERYFWTRLFTDKIPCRGDDAGRIFAVFILIIGIVNNLVTMYVEARNYLRHQQEIRFINKH